MSWPFDQVVKDIISLRLGQTDKGLDQLAEFSLVDNEVISVAQFLADNIK